MGDESNEHIDQFITALQSEDHATHSQAWLLLRNLKDTAAVEPLIAFLKDARREVRQMAVLGLGSLRDPRAIEPLIALLEDEMDTPNFHTSVGSSVAWALGEISSPQAVEPLIKCLDIASFQPAAIKALAKIGDRRAVEPLVRLFETTHNTIIATILGNLGDGRAVESLIRAMDDPHPRVRFYTVRALGKLRDKRALPILAWAKENDTAPILETQSIRGKSVSYVAAKAIEAINSSPQQEDDPPS